MEHRFRAWNKETKTMIDLHAITPLALAIDPTLVGARTGVYIPDDDRIVIMQSTGLKDKEGVDLDWWEGDLFKHLSGLCVIKWHEGGLYMHGAGGWSPAGDAPHWAVLPEKIGNIHTHPELLGESK